MIKILLLFILFYLMKTNHAKVSNEIFSILHNSSNRGISHHQNGTYDTLFSASSNHMKAKSVRARNKNLLRIPFLDSNYSSSLVCYPASDEDFRTVYNLAHVACRKMGFMTFLSIRPKKSPLYQARIKPKNIICTDLQKGTPSCEIARSGKEDCRMVTEVICGACNGTFKGFKGVINSPGFPFAYIKDVTCEWNIIVPEHHDITLSFNQFDAMDMESAELLCGLHNPYVYVLYGIQSRVTVYRYCGLKEVQNLTIPFHSVKIIIFTGIQPNKEKSLPRNELGITLTFEAVEHAGDKHASPMKLLAFFLLGVTFIACIILCHYVKKSKLFDCIVKDQATKFSALPMEQPYDIHNNKTTQNENLKLNKYSREDGVKAQRVEHQRNSKMVYESGKGFNEYSNLLDPAARFIPSVTRDSGDNKEKLNANLHKKLNSIHSYHGQEDPNRLSVSTPKDYYDYPSFTTSRHHASSVSYIEDEKKKLKPSKSSF